MRKGFTLIEVLVVVIVLPFMMLVLNDLFRTLITDVPRSYRVVQENTSLLSMLDHIQKDIDKAKGLPESFGGYTAGDKLLLIELPEGMICYQLKDEKVLRHMLTDNQQSAPGGLEQTVWSVPHAKVEWQVWRNDGDGPPAAGFDWNPALLGAVEVKTHIEHKIRGEHWEKKMANSHLYFVGAL
jgi:prepilin-type N-terminal cleavage/methylation domain-containing protein